MAEQQSEKSQSAVLRRKAGSERQVPAYGRVTPDGVLRAALEHGAESSLGLILSANNVVESQTGLADFVETLPEHALMIATERPGAGFGLVVLDFQALSALIEMQTTGQVRPGAAVSRPPTRTDAALAADFIDRVLEEIEERSSAADLEIAPVISGFRYARPLPDPRTLLMMLPDLPYRCFSQEVDLNEGAKTGAIQILFPLECATGTGGEAKGDWPVALRAIVDGTSVTLSAVLTRMDMPLETVTGFAPGTLVPMQREVLEHLQIEDMNGQAICTGRLGQADGKRAVRLSLAPGATDEGAQAEPAAELNPVAIQAPEEVADMAAAPPLAALTELPQEMPQELPEELPDELPALEITPISVS